MEIRPGARLILGFQGRIEMDAGARAVVLLREGDGARVWYERKGTLVQTVKLTKDVFLNLLVGLLQ